MFKLAAILTPWVKINYVAKYAGRYTGYSDYYIFGIRVARVQQTVP